MVSRSINEVSRSKRIYEEGMDKLPLSVNIEIKKGGILKGI